MTKAGTPSLSVPAYSIWNTWSAARRVRLCALSKRRVLLDQQKLPRASLAHSNAFLTG